MTFFPHSEEDIKEMSDTLNIQSVDELFKAISEKNLNPVLDLPEPMSEEKVFSFMKRLSEKNTAGRAVSFAGGGIYDHYIPAAVDEISSRTEYYTAYTPYQAEVSQGTLQTIYEFQSMICSLTGMHAANASMYDGATALAEAILMAFSIRQKSDTVYISDGVNPRYKEVIKTYLSGLPYDIKYIPLLDNGQTDIDSIREKVSRKTGCVVFQNPNYFGVFEDISGKLDQYRADTGLLGICSVNPITQSIIKGGDELGFDIVTGEGQPLGMYPNFGGPLLGFMATTKKNMRKLPGRIVGESTDSNGQKCFVLTLQAREQHIRRDKATSNICSNQALCATRATVFMSLLGKNGMRELALTNMKNAGVLKEIFEEHSYKPVFDSNFFNEFTVKKDHLEKEYSLLCEKGVIPGILLRPILGEEFRDCMLVCATEKDFEYRCEILTKALKEVRA